MVFEKAKVLKAAEKFLSQGKITAAIKEYRQIIKHDPADLTTLNMLGDLLARAGEKDEAVSCFSRIAEHYREQEFRLKAIAMYKKIEKLKPNDPETAFKLADLYSAQGLVVDARAQYLIVADANTRAGRTREALEILHKIADLDTQNTDIRKKLAEGYLKEGMEVEAAKAYSEAGLRQLERGELEESLDTLSKAFELRPDDKRVLRGLVSVHGRLGTADDAAVLLEKLLLDAPEDPELLDLLAQTSIEADDAAGAERATERLMALDASNHRRYIEVARAYLKQGDTDDAARILGMIIEPMLAGREENDLLELVNELLERAPENVAGLRLLARIHWWQRDSEKLRTALEHLAESAETAGLVDDERYALTQLVRLAPDERKFVERLEELGGSLEEVADVTQLSEEPALSAVPSFESFALVEEQSVTSEVEAAPAAEFEWNSVAEERFTDNSASFADLNEIEVDSIETLDAAINQEVTADGDVHEFSLTPESLDHAPQQEAVHGVGESRIHQELESVDFYISQGYTDIAQDTLQLLERQFGHHAEIDLRKQRLASGSQNTPVVESFELGNESVVSETSYGVAGGEVSVTEIEQPVVSAAAPVEHSAVVTGIDSGLAEIFEEFRVEAEGEHASTNEDFETHYNMATAYKEMDLLDEAIREFQTAAALTAPADGTARYFQCCNMLGHCFSQKAMPRAAVLWFKKGLETPGRTPEEYKALQYELGSAYEQMGDTTRAIGAFTEVYGVDVGYRDIADRLHDLQARQSNSKKKKKVR